MKRRIIRINEEKCNGCGLCEKACHEGAIKVIGGKARLVSEDLCDGMGSCLVCPENAIEIIEAESQAQRKPLTNESINNEIINKNINLNSWPVQIHLIHPKAKFLANADLLIASDCTAFAYPNFHRDFLKNRVVLIGCPKLDDLESYIEKFKDILLNNDIKSITVIKMEVPCCNGMSYAVRKAMALSDKIIPYSEVTVSIDGKIIN